MDFDEWMGGIEANDYDDIICAMGDAFKAGQQSKQVEIEHRTQVSAELEGELIRKRAEIDALKAKIQELWTELDDRQSKEHIIEKCESIIKELLK